MGGWVQSRRVGPLPCRGGPRGGGGRSLLISAHLFTPPPKESRAALGTPRERLGSRRPLGPGAQSPPYTPPQEILALGEKSSYRNGRTIGNSLES